MARRTDAASAPTLATLSGVEVLQRDGDGELLALFTNRWRLKTALRDHPGLTIEPLVAEVEDD